MKRTAFVVMPFGDRVARQVYECCVRKLCAEFQLDVRAADEIFSTNPIYDDIVVEIQRATIIIADISGLNPNVLYELGIAHTLKQKQTIIITHDAYEEAPFDIAHFRIVRYEDSIEGSRQVEEQLRRTLATVLQDLKEVYRDQFELVLDVLVNNGKQSNLISLIGLAQHPGIVRRADPLDSWGHLSTRGYGEQSISIELGLAAFVKMQYIDIRADVMCVTELGRAFVELLKDRGFVCDKFNDQIYTAGFALPLGQTIPPRFAGGDSAGEEPGTQSQPSQ